MTKDEYARYLLTPHWKATNAQVHERSGGRCERFYKGERCMEPHQHTHHLTYVRLGRELMTDLIGVCEMCHRYLHGKVKIDPAMTESRCGAKRI